MSGRLTATLLLVAATAGCLAPTQRREEGLVRSARMFNDDFRWSRFEALTTYLPREDAAPFLKRADAAGPELVFADYEVMSITFAPGSEKALVGVKVEWYRKREMTVKSTVLEQRWEYREGQWLMAAQRRTRGDRFPLVLEPTEKKPDAQPAKADDESP